MKTNLLLFILSLMTFSNSWSQTSQGNLKYQILNSIIDTMSKTNHIDLMTIDSNYRIDIVVNYSTNNSKISSGILGWAINFDTLQYEDSNVYLLLKNKYKTHSVNIEEPGSIKYIDEYANSDMGNNVYGRRTPELYKYAALIIGKPILMGWQPLDILEILTDPNIRRRGDGYINRYKYYKSDTIYIPIMVVKTNKREIPVNKRGTASQYLVEYTLYADNDFSSISWKLKRIICLNKLW